MYWQQIHGCNLVFCHDYRGVIATNNGGVIVCSVVITEVQRQQICGCKKNCNSMFCGYHQGAKATNNVGVIICFALITE